MRLINFLAIFILVFLISGIVYAQVIGIMTTPPGSFTHSAGSAIAKVIVEKLGLNATVQPGATRPFGAIDAGLAVFSLANASDLSLAFLGVEEYQDQGPRKNLRMAATLMPMWVALHVRKDSNIKSIKDLKGKRVPSGFHAQKAIARAIQAQLANAGLTYDDVKQVPSPNVARSAEDFGNGKTDVLFFALGSAAVLEVSSKVGGLRVLPIDDSPEAVARMKKIIPELYISEVTPAPNLEGITAPTKVATQDNVLFTHAKAPEEIVYKVVKAIYENKEDLIASFAAFKNFSPKRMATPIREVNYHPGAIKFYKEVGIWQSKP